MAPVGSFHLKFEQWDKLKHIWPIVMEGFGGWSKVKNLPLDYWYRRISEVIGDHFWGLERIASETLNLINYTEARIKVKKNLCGFMPSTIEIKDLKRGNTFLNFDDIEQLNLLSKIMKGTSS